MSYTLVCHVDGASRGNPGPAGAGVVVYDGSGRERRTASVFLGETTNNAAEYAALREALKAAGEVCRQDGVSPGEVFLVIRTDSQLVARQVSGEYRMRSEDLRPLLEAFRQAARAFRRVDVEHVPRRENRRSDELANQAIDRALGGGESGASSRSRYSLLEHLECSRCGERADPAGPAGSCPSCGGPLLARYALGSLAWPPGEPGGELAPSASPERGSMWRYHQLLPVTSPRCVVSLGEGRTPLVPLPGLERRLGLPRVWLKDEGRNPTATFKARGASAAVSKMVELGVSGCILPTAGNAGSAFAAYTARAGLEFTAVMPEDTPEAIRRECESYGAGVRVVPGLLPDAARLAREQAGQGWYRATTFEEPYRVEGKKTIGLELFEAFGGRWPDAVVCPVGGGVALVGIWKAAQELAEAGVAGAGRPPRLFAVQAAGCCPVVKAFDEGRQETEPFSGAETVAAGLRVPAPKAGFLVLRALRETGGGALAVPDEEIIRTAAHLRRTEGLDLCPEGAAAVAALGEMASRGWLEGCREVVVVNTGSGLKYPR